MNEKLKELIIYISKLSAEDSHFGSIKLNKILFYSDIIAFGHGGASITGCTYKKRPYGPTPQGIRMLKDEMEDARDLRVDWVPSFNGTQKKPVALREANLGSVGITEDQRKIVDFVVDSFKGMNGPQTSLSSHDFRWWAVEMGEEIKLETVFLTPRPLTEKENAYGLTLETAAA